MTDCHAVTKGANTVSMTFDTRIAVVLRDDLATWQKLNVTAFIVSGIAATVEDVTGEPYVDRNWNRYLPMFKQPVYVYEADATKIRTVFDRARSREIEFAAFTENLFATGNDIDNRLAFASVAEPDMDILGLAFRTDRKVADKILKGVSFHP
jgi:hypothetical protein